MDRSRRSAAVGLTGMLAIGVMSLALLGAALTPAVGAATPAAALPPAPGAAAVRSGAPAPLHWSDFAIVKRGSAADGWLGATSQGVTGSWVQYGRSAVPQTASALVVNGVVNWGAVTSHETPGGAYSGYLASATAGSRVLLAYRAFSGPDNTWIVARTGTVDGRSETWAEPLRISNPNLLSAGQPYIALSADGSTAIAIFEEWGGVGYQARVAIGRVRGTQFEWSPPRLMDPAAGSYSRGVAVSADGSRAIALWSTGSELLSSVGIIGATDIAWSEPVNVDSNNGNGSGVRVEFAPDGRHVVAAWQGWSGRVTVRATSGAIGPDGQVTWAEPTTLSPDTLGAGGALSLAASADLGTVVVTWYQLTLGSPEVRASVGRRDDGLVTWAPARAISGQGLAVDPVASVTADGSAAVVAWSGPSNGGANTVGVARAQIGASEQWTAPTNLMYPPGDASPRSVAFVAGNAVIVGASVYELGGTAQFAAAVGAPFAAPSVEVEIDGRAKIGRSIRAAVTASGVPAPEVSYRWSRLEGSTYVPIPGATERAYAVTEADAGRDLRVTVTATNSRESDSASATVRAGRLEQETVGLPPLPGRLRTGLTVIARGPVTTTAGQPARISVQWQPTTLARGDVAVRKVHLPDGGVGVYVPRGATGAVTVRIRADATATYRALSIRRTYVIT